EQKYRVGQRGSSVQPHVPEPEQRSGDFHQIQMYTSPEGKDPIKTFEMAEHLESSPEYYCINTRVLGQSTHEGILRQHLQDEYGCFVELGSELLSFEQYSDRVVARIEQQVTETASFEFLVGADGAHSVTRRQLGLTFLGETRSNTEGLIVGDIHLKGLDQNYWRMWGSNDHKVFTLRPYEIKGDDRYTFMVGGNDLDFNRVSSREDLIETFYQVTGRKDIDFGDLIWMGIWRPNIRLADKFGEGRVFIVGDAAHVHSPTGGQGMNSSVQDTFNLAWKLALVLKGHSPSSLLDTYTEERLPVIAAMLGKTTLLLKKTFKPGGFDEEAWTRGFELRQFGISYRGSGITEEEEIDPYRAGLDGTLRAGDRAPEAPGLRSISPVVAGPTSLFNILKTTSHTVILFATTGDSYPILRALGVYPEGLVKPIIIYPQSSNTTLQEGYAYKHYKVQTVGSDLMGSTVCIVRPDGYIGYIGASNVANKVDLVEGVQKYFRGIFL
ncbi:hypothetical protein BT96DRAFT_914279, partial [Gymnopus androsaceus JB14]